MQIQTARESHLEPHWTLPSEEGDVCPYCQTPLQPKEQVIVCPTCRVAHHLECWTENRRCTTYGCPVVASGQQRREAPAAPAQRPPRPTLGRRRLPTPPRAGPDLSFAYKVWLLHAFVVLRAVAYPSGYEDGVPPFLSVANAIVSLWAVYVLSKALPSALMGRKRLALKILAWGNVLLSLVALGVYALGQR